MLLNTLHASFKCFSQLLLIQPTTNAKVSLNRRHNNSSNDTRRCWLCSIYRSWQIRSQDRGWTLKLTLLATDWRWRCTPIRLKVARNEVKNASFAQRSAHRDSRIWRPELIESAAEHKRRARRRRRTSKHRPTPTQRFCHSAIFHPITPIMFNFSESADIGLSFWRKKWKHIRADFEKFQEMCENLNYRKR